MSLGQNSWYGIEGLASRNVHEGLPLLAMKL